MTPKEKANSLMYSFLTTGKTDGLTALAHAQVCVNEILSILPYPPRRTGGSTREYWEEVKEELKQQDI